jgi:hypothetical protein
MQMELHHGLYLSGETCAALNDVSPSALVEAFAGNLETLDPTLHQTFVEGCTKYQHKRSSNQKQYQDLDQEKKQERGASRQTAKSAENGNGSIDTSRLDAVVREASRHFTRDSDVDLKLDTVRSLLHSQGLNRDVVTRQAILVSLARVESQSF